MGGDGVSEARVIRLNTAPNRLLPAGTGGSGRSLGGAPSLITEIVFIGGRRVPFPFDIALEKSFHLAEILISLGMDPSGEGKGGEGREGGVRSLLTRANGERHEKERGNGCNVNTTF